MPRASRTIAQEPRRNLARLDDHLSLSSIGKLFIAIFQNCKYSTSTFDWKFSNKVYCFLVRGAFPGLSRLIVGVSLKHRRKKERKKERKEKTYIRIWGFLYFLRCFCTFASDTYWSEYRDD
jgi:hypothetical protein